MNVDVNSLELLPAEIDGLKPCRPGGTCGFTCIPGYTRMSRND